MNDDSITYAPECAERCQYAIDTGMTEYSCSDRCEYMFMTVDPAPGNNDELKREADVYQAMRAVIIPYSWLASNRGSYEYDEHEGYENDVRTFVSKLLECLPLTRSEPFQSVLASRSSLRDKVIAQAARMETLESTKAELLNALLLAGKRCEQVHHAKLDQHGLGEPCPVEARIAAIIKKATT